ncbi:MULTISPECIES: transketolase [Atopobiaceae]|uniref:Transketolase n=1 Tax=Parafannyhessea umbonata TaxID=604330 RepID=A0A1H9Q4C9_9ACTN|nr:MULTISPECIES: transketolase [Atopobiaceae]SEH48720.1 transketolase [Parafannyhessea umbonata]SER54789.1 transketolase [Parafannyhessea umbonata]SJZ66842.1 transketolase [Olsenella sp. KH1P3]
MEEKELKNVKLLAAKVRRDVLSMLQHRGYGHVGGSLSLVEAYAVLYGKQLRYDASNPHWDERDRVVLSKGHAGPVMYSTLAECGFFPKEWLNTLNDGGTRLPSHTDRLKTPGVDATTGSLGQGTSEAVGIAQALAVKGSKNYTYLFVGDGELNEGQCWEAFQYLAAKKLSRCIVLIDDNKKQLDGTTDEVMYNFDLAKKMESFGFKTQVVNGQDVEAIDAAIDVAKQNAETANCIVLDTIKGAGVPYFEQAVSNHSMKWNNDEINKATDEAIAKLDEEIERGEA